MCEDFFRFTQLKVVNAENVTEKVLGKLPKLGNQLTRLRGKGLTV